jgi:hypothetical protein
MQLELSGSFKQLRKIRICGYSRPAPLSAALCLIRT